MIGAGLAINAVMHGESVVVMDQRTYEEIVPGFQAIFQIFIANNVCRKEEAEKYLQQITFTPDLEMAVKDADLIQESIIENAEIKKNLYKTIQQFRGERKNQPIIASSTSLLFPSVLSEGALYPEKLWWVIHTIHLI